MNAQRIKPSSLARNSVRLRLSGRYDCFARELRDYCEGALVGDATEVGACAANVLRLTKGTEILSLRGVLRAYGRPGERYAVRLEARGRAVRRRCAPTDICKINLRSSSCRKVRRPRFPFAAGATAGVSAHPPAVKAPAVKAAAETRKHCLAPRFVC